jgi:hypothetical protein
MNYLEIVLQGYFDENNKEYLDKYFYREYKKAEKEHFEADEFFNGCLKLIEVWEGHLLEQVSNRYCDLCMMLANAKDGTLKYDNLEGKSYEQKTQETIKYCEHELADQRPDGIGSIFFTVHLRSLTNGQFAYNMPYSELLQIKLAILETYQKILKKEINIQPPPAEKKEGSNKVKKTTTKRVYEKKLTDICDLVEKSWRNESDRTREKLRKTYTKAKGQYAKNNNIDRSQLNSELKNTGDFEYIKTKIETLYRVIL